MSRRRRRQAKQRPRKRVETETYTDAEGNSLTLRKALSPASIAKIGEAPSEEAGDAVTLDDAWKRREEMLFERLVVSWEIAGVPLDDQKLLIGRYRMAGAGERRFIHETIAAHVDRWIPGL